MVEHQSLGKISNRDQTVTGGVQTGLQMRGDSAHSTSQDRKGQITLDQATGLAEGSAVALEAVSTTELLDIRPLLVTMTLTIGKFDFFYQQQCQFVQLLQNREGVARRCSKVKLERKNGSDHPGKVRRQKNH